MASPIEFENTGILLNAEISDNDLLTQFQKLHSKIDELEREKKEISNRYDVQRARLSEIYSKKEAELKTVKLKQAFLEDEIERLTKELNEAKSQICIAGILKEHELEAEKQKAQTKFPHLQQIDNDSSDVTPQSSFKKPNAVMQMLDFQMHKARGEKDKEGILMASSNVFSSAKSLARKFVGQTQEEVDILKSSFIPSEKKSQELEKSAEEKLKKLESDKFSPSESFTGKNKREKISMDSSHNTSQESGVPSPRSMDSKSPLKEGEKVDFADDAQETTSAVSRPRVTSCDMCVNYEAQLVAQQDVNQQLEKQKDILEATMERFKEDLIKETQFRKRMEDKWNEKKEKHKAQVSQLKSLYETAESELRSLQNHFKQVQEDVKAELSGLRFEREKIDGELRDLQRENNNLMGKYKVHSEQLRKESINFPDDVDALHELLLKSHEELIDVTVAKETNEEQVKSLKCEIQLLMDEMKNDSSDKDRLARDLLAKNTLLRERLDLKETETLELLQIVEKLKANEKKNEEQIITLKSHLDTLKREKRQHEENISELRGRVGSLQQGLDTSETVQKDFVTLSQSLQIELEKLRGADSEVRWEHDEDAVECRGCRNPFAGGKRKDHCRHCGKIFCCACLSNVVLSGPHNRPSHVCHVCHTLLNRETAPYFSQKPPHLPD